MIKQPLIPHRWLFEGEVLRLMGLTVLAKPIGLFTQVLIAKHFGAGTQFDAYLLAIFLATLLSRAILRVYSAVVVPFLIDLKNRADAEVLPRQMALNLLYGAGHRLRRADPGVRGFSCT
jgi:peptidoglycan biosynthesis protein MviN/MurJ (putative lipid II flippase)